MDELDPGFCRESGLPRRRGGLRDAPFVFCAGMMTACAVLFYPETRGVKLENVAFVH